MRNLLLIFFISLSCHAQIGEKVENDFIKILQLKDSKEIAKSSNLKSIKKKYNKKALVYLAKFFDIPTKTNVYSTCQSRFLTKGEVAIIVADQIDRMPYAELTGIQNCTLQFCKKNPNLIEYYFSYIKSYPEFQSKYYQYLKSTRK